MEFQYYRVDPHRISIRPGFPNKFDSRTSTGGPFAPVTLGNPLEPDKKRRRSAPPRSSGGATGGECEPPHSEARRDDQPCAKDGTTK